MKKLNSTIVSFFILTGFISCDNQLDLVPTDVLVEQSVFADIQTAESALSNIYFKLYESSTGATHVIADASLNHVGLNNGSSLYNYTGGNISVTDGAVEAIWQKYYEVINIANVFIDKVPVFGIYNEVIKNQHIAEAKFNRAYAYWALLCYYGHGSLTGNSQGLGLPLQLLPYEGFTEENLIARSTNEEVYTQIIKDLTEAIIDLPEVYSDNIKTRARATKATAYAMLSRVHLYKRDYQACLETSNSMLAYSNYQLDPDLLNLFPLNLSGVSSRFSNEIIFGFPASSNNGNFQFGIHNIGYRNKSIWADNDFINSMDPNDKRRTELIYEGNPLITNPTIKLRKTTFKFNNPDERDDIPVIRLAEILLNKAEALAQIDGVNLESVTILNEIKERSGLLPVVMSDFSSKEELLAELYRERYLETVFEGRARFDFIRTNRPLRNENLTEDQKTFPIPQREIDISGGKLIQNPGYIN